MTGCCKGISLRGKFCNFAKKTSNSSSLNTLVKDTLIFLQIRVKSFVNFAQIKRKKKFLFSTNDKSIGSYALD
jgi:hypothetical protein